MPIMVSPFRGSRAGTLFYDAVSRRGSSTFDSEDASLRAAIPRKWWFTTLFWSGVFEGRTAGRRRRRAISSFASGLCSLYFTFFFLRSDFLHHGEQVLEDL